MISNSALQSQHQQKSKSFYLKYTCPETGQLLEGQFTTKRLSIKETIMVGSRRVQLNGGFHYDANKPGYGVPQMVDTMSMMLAQLEFSLIQKPQWFDLDNISDLELIGQVFEEVALFENTFSDRRDARAAGLANSSTGNSQATGSETQTTGQATPVVGSQIPATLEP